MAFMAEDNAATTGIASHGATRLPSVEIDSFNIELKDGEGFIGDRASKGAFRKIFDRWRTPLRKTGKDPFGDLPSEKAMAGSWRKPIPPSTAKRAANSSSPAGPA